MDHNDPGHYSQRHWLALRENYCTSLSDLGAIPIPIPPILSCLDNYLDMIDGLMITGGDFDIDPKFYEAKEIHPSVKVKTLRTECELYLFKKAMDRNIPILGICGGEQVINVGLGGTLIQHIPETKPNALNHSTGADLSHSIQIETDSQLFKILNKHEITVNSSHHQSVDKLGNQLRIAAKSEDGIIEAIEHIHHKFCLGVQFHPEFCLTQNDINLLKAFINAA